MACRYNDQTFYTYFYITFTEWNSVVAAKTPSLILERKDKYHIDPFPENKAQSIINDS